MTQQYTPVAWQDETTSQQGTLINAERLNQMQTAHHYADGFEEVDAVPTADPSVAYHKVVYCTADNTFYRWDGTEWTKDIDDETKALLQQEIARATEAEGELAQDIADETARATAQEQDLASRITAEASARNQADTALGNRITAEATARESADTELGADIGAETARARQAEQANAQAIATHVADKANPHEVTKAQVGLGNVDNTADLDKPVSTATQSALNEKASTTAVQAVTVRVDTLESAVADTYNKAQIDTYLAAKADKATTYTKTETDTLLATKADASTTYTKTEVQTYVSNALDSYAPMVRTTGNQTIGGEKLFTGVIINQRPNYSALVLRNTSVDAVNHDGGEHMFSITFQDKNGVSMATIRAGMGTNGKCSLGGTVRNSDGTTKYYTIAIGD